MGRSTRVAAGSAADEGGVASDLVSLMFSVGEWSQGGSSRLTADAGSCKEGPDCSSTGFSATGPDSGRVAPQEVQ